MTGHVWVGTEDGQGLWEYDSGAKAWTHFPASPDLSGDIYALCCDKSGRIWAGGLSGVSVYNGRQWRQYGLTDGPLGTRLFALAVNPKDGGVWGATEAGLFRYQNSRWTYFTRADGLPSDQANALAFAPDGTLYVGTQCDGIAIGSSDDNYKTWRTTPGPAQMPNAATGRGLPSGLINALLVTRDGTVYAGTSCGLASSIDGGDSWHYTRGVNWKDKLAGLFPPVAPMPSALPGNLLSEDYVTTLAERTDGSIFVGHRQTGVEAFDPKTGLRVQSGANGATTTDYISTLLLTGQSVWLGRYGGGLLMPPTSDKIAAVRAASAAVSSLPVPAKPPTLTELKAITARVMSLPGELPVGSGAYLGEDWQTQGDAIGRYGRQYARLFAMQSPWGDHFPTSAPGYLAVAKIGPRYADHDALRFWVHWTKTDNPNSQYDPELGYRRQAEADDHGEAVDRVQEGPDIWIHVSVPSGLQRVSLYFFNKDGHDADNRDRDYLVSLLPYRIQTADARALAPLAQTRVRSFWGGVYKSFLVRGPSPYYVRIARNYSFNTLCSAVFIDKLAPLPKQSEDMSTFWLGAVRYDPPTVPPTKNPFASLNACRAFWSELDAKPHLVQMPLRLLLYRAALVSGGPRALLANWRWRLNFWQKKDRVEFDSTMASAYASFLNLNPSERTASH